MPPFRARDEETLYEYIKKADVDCGQEFIKDCSSAGKLKGYLSSVWILIEHAVVMVLRFCTTSGMRQVVLGYPLEGLVEND